MKHLSLAQDRQRLTLVVPDLTPLRSAAKSIRGYTFEGRNDGHAIFSFPAAPDVAVLVVEAFEPTLSPSSKPAIQALVAQDADLRAATNAKGADTQLGCDAALVTTPMSQQIGAFNFAMARLAAGGRGTGFLMEQGTGKSLAAIAVANALYLQGRIEWAMVIAPNSLKGTWAAPDGEILTHTNLHIVPAKTMVPKGRRDKKLAQAAEHVRRDDCFPWVVTNYESFALDPRKNRDHADLLKGWQGLAERPGLVVIDESTMVKNDGAKRTMAIKQLAERFAATLILTGTPVTASPLDVYAQFQVMESGALGFHSFLAFDRAYAMRQTRRTRSATFSEVVGFHNLDDLEDRVAKLSYRARAADCLDLPPVMTKRIPVTLSKQQATIIGELKTEMMAELDDGATIDGRNILTRYLRMGQTIGGHVGTLTPEGRAAEHPLALDPNPKLDALREHLELLLDDPSQKAVIFAQYRPEIFAIRDMCREKKWKPAVFVGGQSDEVRETERQRFKKDEGCRVFVAQYQTGSKGLTLVEAASIIFYSLTFKLEDFSQARKRVHRIGQTKTVTEVFLMGEIAGRRGPRQTLDHLIVESLQRKQGFADHVTGDHRKMLEAL